MKRCPVCQKAYDDSASYCVEDASPLGSARAETGLEGRVVDRKYRIERLLGEGGMGSVYEAVHLEIGRRVALKVMNPGLVRDPAALERFRREARAAGRLEHPNAVTIHDFGVDEAGNAYLVMELLDGSTLREVLHERQVLPPDEVCTILEPVAAAIDAAHASGIIHRDLKPDNIMLARRGSRTVVKVLDFGIAKVAAPDSGGGTLTGTGVIGTPSYMSPEQGEGQPLDARSDVYSLGIIAFELLTGRVPFHGDTPISTLVKHVNTPPPRPSTVVPTLGVQVDDVVLWALEKSPSRRPQSASAFVEALRSAISTRLDAETIALDRTVAVSARTMPVPSTTVPGRPFTGPHPTPGTVPVTSRSSDTGGSQRSVSTALIVGMAGLVIALLLVGVAISVYTFREQLGLTSSQAPVPIEPQPVPQPATPAPVPSDGQFPGGQYTPTPPNPRGATATVTAPTISASSTRASQGANIFSADRAMDGRRETAWCEGDAGPGIGESITLRFAAPLRISRLRLLAGYFKSGDRWSQNNRLALVRVVLSDGRTIAAPLDDIMSEQSIAIGGGEVEWVTLVIEKVWPGGDGLDTLISEITIDAG